VNRTDPPRGVLSPLALLLLFVLVVRFVPDLVRPAAPPDDCDRIASSDLAALERCLVLRPDDIELMLDAGSRYERAGALDRAEELYRRALRVDPKDGEVHLRLGAVLLARGDRQGAGAEARAALKVQPGSAAAEDLAQRAGGAP
jgi:tetratricopeptide (TPR) repeat protein